MTEQEKMEERAERKLRQVIREFVEAYPETSYCSTWVYNINGDRYSVDFEIHKDGEEE